MSSTTTSTLKGFPPVAEFYTDEREHRRQIARKLNQLNQAKFNCIIDVTLNANTGATIINDNRIGFYSAVIGAMPMSLDASADIGTLWCDAPTVAFASTSASITVHHRISSGVARKIRFCILD